MIDSDRITVLGYDVDVVMCIDATAGMGNVMDEVREKARSFYAEVKKAMEKRRRVPDRVRVKVIAFRDYAVDCEPMQVSDFFKLCDGEGDQSAQFKAFVDEIQPIGGGDVPENALEALHLAMQSDWDHTGSKRRHVIIVFTDAPALPLGDETMEYVIRDGSTKQVKSRVGTANYPKGMPKSLAELQEIWEETNGIDEKRLLLFAPDAYPWNTLCDWRCAWLSEEAAGQGLSELRLEQVLGILAEAI